MVVLCVRRLASPLFFRPGVVTSVVASGRLCSRRSQTNTRTEQKEAKQMNEATSVAPANAGQPNSFPELVDFMLRAREENPHDQFIRSGVLELASVIEQQAASLVAVGDSEQAAINQHLASIMREHDASVQTRAVLEIRTGRSKTAVRTPRMRPQIQRRSRRVVRAGSSAENACDPPPSDSPHPAERTRWLNELADRRLELNTRRQLIAESNHSVEEVGAEFIYTDGKLAEIETAVGEFVGGFQGVGQ